MFSLPGRGFHQRVTLISSVPMTLDDVIVHVRQFIIALVSVDGCSSFSDPDGFLMCRILRLGSLSTMLTPSQSMMWFSVVAWSVRADLLMVDINLSFPLLVYFSFFRVVYILSVFLQSCFSSLHVSPMYSAPQFLHGIWFTSSPCSSSSTLSLGCTNKRLRVVWGRIAVATPYFFSTRCTLSLRPPLRMG